MGGACNKRGRDENCIPEGKRLLKDLGVDGRIILEWILGK